MVVCANCFVRGLLMLFTTIDVITSSTIPYLSLLLLPLREDKRPSVNQLTLQPSWASCEIPGDMRVRKERVETTWFCLPVMALRSDRVSTIRLSREPTRNRPPSHPQPVKSRRFHRQQSRLSSYSVLGILPLQTSATADNR